MLENGIVDLRPKIAEAPIASSPAYASSYFQMFSEPTEILPLAMAWGAPETVPVKWADRRRFQVDQVRRLLPGGAVMCDVSAGAGYYTFAYAKQFALVLHCDLSISSLNYAARSAVSAGHTNIVFLRIDYLRPPFRAAIDVILCFDTLIRGFGHEQQLLHAMRSCLVQGGAAIVDFHNWWHNPLRRLGIMRDTFHDNRSYTRAQIESLFRAVDIQPYEYLPICENDKFGLYGHILKLIIPPTRFVYRFRSSA